MRNWLKPDVVGVIVSVVFGIITVFDWTHLTPQETGHAVMRYGLTLLCAIALLVLFTVSLRQKSGMKLTEDELRRRIKALEEQLNALQKTLTAVESSFTAVHRVSHKLRDEVHKLIPSPAVEEGEVKRFDKKALEKEQAILSEVCSEISDLFETLTNTKCHVAISCRDPDSGDHDPTCYLWAKSFNYTPVCKIGDSLRINENTRLRAVWDHPGPGIASYFCPDVRKEHGYQCKIRFKAPDAYTSTLVVALRCLQDPEEFLGFLKLETKEPQKLNGGWHAQLLAAVGDEIYSFLDASRALEYIDGA